MKFEDLFNTYLDCHLKQKTKRWKDSEYAFNKHCQIFIGKDAMKITKLEIVKWRADLKEKTSGDTANRTHQMIRAVYNWGIEAEAIKKYNPAAQIGKFKERPRKRFLHTYEIPKFYSGVKKVKNQVTADFFLMLLHTSVRKTNVLSMRWNEIDFDQEVWEIPITKNDDPLIVPLIPEALAILRRRQSEADCEWVFESSRIAGKRLCCPNKAWATLLVDAELTDLRMHDLRRTGASYQAINGVNLSTIAATLGHRSIKSTTIYAQLGSVEPVRAAMMLASAKMQIYRPSA